MRDSFWLTMCGVPTQTWSHRIKVRKQVIGRTSDCPIRIVDKKASRRHAAIWERGGIVFVRDLESRNGTFVAGDRITRSALPIGVPLRIGDTTLEVVGAPNPALTASYSRLSISTELDAALPADPTASIAALTDAQRQVLRLLVRGESVKQVAAALALSRHTVHSHAKEIYRLVGVHSRAELIARCWSAVMGNSNREGELNTAWGAEE